MDDNMSFPPITTDAAVSSQLVSIAKTTVDSFTTCEVMVVSIQSDECVLRILAYQHRVPT